MNLLNEVDKPGSDVEMYISQLDKILLANMDQITGLRSRLCNFRDLLTEENKLSHIFYQE